MAINTLAPTFESVFSQAYLAVFHPTRSEVKRSPDVPFPAVMAGPDDEVWKDLRAEAMREEAIQKAQQVVTFVTGYRTHLVALDVDQEGIRSYLVAERQVLTELYTAAREPFPSPARVRASVYRYAMDARCAIEPPFDRFDFRQTDGQWHYGEFPPGGWRSDVLGPPGGYRPVTAPLGPVLLAAVMDRIDSAAIVNIVEAVFRDQPPRADDVPPSGTRTDLPAVDPQTLAIAMLTELPRPTMIEIAKRINVNRKQLYDSEHFQKFRDIAELIGAMKKKGTAGRRPRGSKTADGRLEAEDPGETADGS